MLLLLFVSFISGCLLTAASVAAGIFFWFYSQSVSVEEESVDGDEGTPFIQPHLPQQLLTILHESSGGQDGQLQVQEETCRWLNFLVAFVFSELRDSIAVKRLIMKKISKEFEEVMFTKTEGKLIEQLTVRDYFLGTSLPVIKSARLVRVEGLPSEGADIGDIEEIDVYLEVEYSGNFQISIDVDLVFNKAAYVSFGLSKLSGTGRLRFSRKNEASWSFAFVKDPLIEMTVSSHFEGRQYHKLSSIIESQVRKWVKKKHTLPAAKTRYKPFFRKPKPQNQLLEVYCHDEKMTVGKLSVSLLECNRLKQISGAYAVFCTVAIGSQPEEPLMNLWKTQWPLHEFKVSKAAAEESIGIYHKLAEGVFSEMEKSGVVVVSRVMSPSAADRAGVKKGDILTRVNNVRVTSLKQARRLMKTFKSGGSVLLLVQRPPPHCIDQLLTSSLRDRDARSPLSTESASVHEYDVITSTNDLTASSTHTGNAPSSDSRGTAATLHTTSNSVSAISGPQQSSSSSLSASVSVTSSSSFSASCAPSIVVSTQQHPREHLGLPRQSSLQLQPSHTLMPSEERFSVSESHGAARSNLRRRNRAAVEQSTDTVSLCGVRGEKRAGREGNEEEEEDEDGGEEEEEDGEAGGGGPSHHAAAADDLVDSREGVEARTRGRGREQRNGDTGPRSNDDHVVLRNSREVQACRNPVWNQRFKFDVEEPHRYLNICIWERLVEDRGNYLIGYVTIPLMDIAIECFQTASSRHMQKYVLVTSSHDRAYSSRTAAEAANSRFSKKSKTPSKVDSEEQPYSGNILLRFKHSSKLMEDGDLNSQRDSSSPQGDRSSSRTSSNQSRRPHKFVIIELDSITNKCDICNKLIWAFNNKVWQCQRCGLKMHKKCRVYCENSVRCRRRSTKAQSGATTATAAASGEAAAQLPEELLAEGSGEHSDLLASLSNSSSAHRELDQPEELETAQPSHRDSARSKDSFVMLDSPDLNVREAGGSDDDWEDVLPGEGGQNLGNEAGGVSAQGDGHPPPDEVDGDSSDVEMVTPYPVSDDESNTPNLLWSGHVPPDERETIINKKVGDLQVEIDRIQEHITNLYTDKNKPGVTSSSLKLINREIEWCQEKMDPLRLLMKKLMFELNEITQEQA